MFQLKRIKDLEVKLKAATDYSERLNKVNKQYIERADELDKEIHSLRESLNSLQTAFDANVLRLGQLKKELSRCKEKLFDANKEKKRYQTYYEALCDDVVKKCNACEVCDHKSCADCVANSHFKWRGEPEV